MSKSTVADVMTHRVVAVREGAQYKDIVNLMRTARVSALPVLDAEDHVIGVVSEGDLLAKEAAAGEHDERHPAGAGKSAEVLAAGLMTHPAVTIERGATVAEAARLMSARRVKRLPVVDGWGHLIGIVSRIDVLSVFSREDCDIRDEVTGILRRFGLDPQAVQVSVRSGIVTVTGPVDIPASAPNLLEEIRHVEAVVEVRDRLSYPQDDHPGTVAPPGRVLSR